MMLYVIICRIPFPWYLPALTWVEWNTIMWVTLSTFDDRLNATYLIAMAFETKPLLFQSLQSLVANWWTIP